MTTQTLLEAFFGPKGCTMRQRIARFGWFERLWGCFVFFLCAYLSMRSEWHWYQITYVGLFALAMPLYIGPAAQEKSGVALTCGKCGKQNTDPGGDVTDWKCGYCGEAALERYCQSCKRAL